MVRPGKPALPAELRPLAMGLLSEWAVYLSPSVSTSDALVVRKNGSAGVSPPCEPRQLLLRQQDLCRVEAGATFFLTTHCHAGTNSRRGIPRTTSPYRGLWRVGLVGLPLGLCVRRWPSFFSVTSSPLLLSV